MKYKLELYFKDKPVCNICMLSRSKGLNLDGETIIRCSALGSRPRCPDEGCHKDCPLKEDN